MKTPGRRRRQVLPRVRHVVATRRTSASERRAASEVVAFAYERKVNYSSITDSGMSPAPHLRKHQDTRCTSWQLMLSLPCFCMLCLWLGWIAFKAACLISAKTTTLLVILSPLINYCSFCSLFVVMSSCRRHVVMSSACRRHVVRCPPSSSSLMSSSCRRHVV